MICYIQNNKFYFASRSVKVEDDNTILNLGYPRFVLFANDDHAKSSNVLSNCSREKYSIHFDTDPRRKNDLSLNAQLDSLFGFIPTIAYRIND